jgi:hypothetical protein
VPPIAIGEADLAIADIDQAGIRHGDAMGIPTDRVDDLGRTRKGGVRIHDPRGGVEVVEEVRKALGGGQGRRGVVEGERGGRAGMRQGFQELGPEDRP